MAVPATTYVVATTPQAGGELLAEALKIVGVAGWPQAYFTPTSDLALGEGRVARYWHAYERFVASVRAQAAGRNGVFGVVMQWDHFAWLVRALHARTCMLEGRETAYGADAAAIVDRALHEPRYVWLRRQDTARQALDHYEQLSTGTVMPASAAERRGAVRSASPADFAHVASLEQLLVEQDRRWGEFFRDAGIEPLELRLDELVEHPAAVTKTTLDFLGLEPVPGGSWPADDPLPRVGSWAESWGAGYSAARSDSPSPEPLPCAAFDRIPAGPRPAEVPPAGGHPVGRDERVLYSCVVDAPAYLRYESLVWCVTLLELAGARPDQLVVHAVEGTDAEHLGRLRDLGATVVPVQPFDARHPFSNKLRQLESEVLRDADRVVLCDCDVAFSGDCSAEIGGPELAARPVDMGCPDYQEWVELTRAAGVAGPLPLRRAPSLVWTYANNLNGGFLVVPAPLLEPLASRWPGWTRRLIADAERLPTGPLGFWFTDQLALGLTVLELGISVRELPSTINLSTMPPMFDAHLNSLHEPLAVHYHKSLTSTGLLTATGVPTIDRSVDRVNDVIRRHASLFAAVRAEFD